MVPALSRSIVPAALLALAACRGDTRVTAALAQAEETDCIHAWADARYRYPGYDHVVVIENACEARAYCEVATNVDPEPMMVVVEAGATTEVLVRRASPAREFVPRVACDLEGAGAPTERIAER